MFTGMSICFFFRAMHSLPQAVSHLMWGMFPDHSSCSRCRASAASPCRLSLSLVPGPGWTPLLPTAEAATTARAGQVLAHTASTNHGMVPCVQTTQNSGATRCTRPEPRVHGRKFSPAFFENFAAPFPGRCSCYVAPEQISSLFFSRV